MQVNNTTTANLITLSRDDVVSFFATANDRLAHMVVLTEDGSIRQVLGPFSTLADAQAHAYRALHDVAETNVRFVPFYSWTGTAYLPHQIASTTSILRDDRPATNEDVAPPHVVLAAPDGELRAFGPFANAAEATEWLGDTTGYPDHSVEPVHSADGMRRSGRAFTGVLDAVTRVEEVLRLSLTESRGLALNDVGEPECVNCEWLPLIGIYGHHCGNTYVEYPVP